MNPLGGTDWAAITQLYFAGADWRNVQATIVADKGRNRVVCPRDEDVFRAFLLTSFQDTKVVIVGQDPYFALNQADGLCFSVRHGPPYPTSLRNIFAERQADLGHEFPAYGSLELWATRGVLLLNSALTVRDGDSGSHASAGWRPLTDSVLVAVAKKATRVVFLLWGKEAQRKAALVQRPPHIVIESSHPAARGADNDFLGSHPFTRTNDALAAATLTPVDWSLD